MDGSTKIAFLGAGNMAQAILGGLLQKKMVTPTQILCSDMSEACCTHLADRYQVKTTTQNKVAVENANILFLCIKPQDLPTVLEEVKSLIRKEHKIISIVAGVSLQKLETAVGVACPIIRAMPNLAALVGESATAIVPNSYADAGFIKDAMDIFDAVGKTIQLADETRMDVVTGLSGSGPAYALIAVQAMADAAVQLGLEKEDALLLATQTIIGAGQLCMKTQTDPAIWVDRISSPGGTTLAGRKALEEKGFSEALVAAVKAATRRSKELGKS